MNIDDESKIIEQIRAGDIDRYADLIDAYKNVVYNLSYRMTGNSSDAEDLTQQAFLKAFEALGRFDTRCRFFPWLYTIALNLVRTFIKKHHKNARRPLEDLAEPSTGDDPAAMLEKRQQSQIVFEMVRQLPLKLREAVVLRFYQDLTYNQIAGLLQISVSAAKMRVNRGVKALARQWDDNDGTQTNR